MLVGGVVGEGASDRRLVACSDRQADGQTNKQREGFQTLLLHIVASVILVLTGLWKHSFTIMSIKKVEIPK